MTGQPTRSVGARAKDDAAAPARRTGRPPVLRAPGPEAPGPQQADHDDGARRRPSGAAHEEIGP